MESNSEDARRSKSVVRAVPKPAAPASNAKVTGLSSSSSYIPMGSWSSTVPYTANASAFLNVPCKSPSYFPSPPMSRSNGASNQNAGNWVSQMNADGIMESRFQASSTVGGNSIDGYGQSNARIMSSSLRAPFSNSNSYKSPSRNYSSDGGTSLANSSSASNLVWAAKVREKPLTMELAEKIHSRLDKFISAPKHWASYPNVLQVVVDEIAKGYNNSIKEKEEIMSAALSRAIISGENARSICWSLKDSKMAAAFSAFVVKAQSDLIDVLGRKPSKAILSGVITPTTRFNSVRSMKQVVEEMELQADKREKPSIPFEEIPEAVQENPVPCVQKAARKISTAASVSDSQEFVVDSRDRVPVRASFPAEVEIASIGPTESAKRRRLSPNEAAASVGSVRKLSLLPDEYSNCKIMVDGHSFFVNTTFLAIHSEYFNQRFKSMPQIGEMQELELMDVDADQIAALLAVVSPAPASVTNDSVEFLLKLGDRYMMPAVKRACSYLLAISDVSMGKKVLLAQRYGLTDLMDHLVSECSSELSVEALSECVEFARFNALTRRLLRLDGRASTRK